MVVAGFDIVVSTAVFGAFVTGFELLAESIGPVTTEVVATVVTLAELVDESVVATGLELSGSDLGLEEIVPDLSIVVSKSSSVKISVYKKFYNEKKIFYQK